MLTYALEIRYCTKSLSPGGAGSLPRPGLLIYPGGRVLFEFYSRMEGRGFLTTTSRVPAAASTPVLPFATAFPYNLSSRNRYLQTMEIVSNLNPDVALPNPGKSTSKTLQLRIFRRLGVIEDVTFGEVLVSPGKACSQVPKVPLQRFSSTPARFL